MAKKNSFLELMRFVFCIVVFVHHSGFLTTLGYPFEKGGLYAVEFFFILTGAFTIKHIEKAGDIDSPMKYSMGYTLGKIKRIFPYALVGTVIAYVYSFISKDPSLSLKDRLFGKWNILYEILFLPLTGVISIGLEDFLNAPLWYVSVMLIVLPVVTYLALRYKDVFMNYICVIVPFLIFGYLMNTYGGIGVWGHFGALCDVGVVRGFADILLGCLVYKISLLINGKINLPSRLLTIVELGGYAFAIYTFSTNVDGYTFLFAVVIMALSVSISLSDKSYTANMDNGFLNHLGKISIPIYCVHWPIYRYIAFYMPQVGYLYGILITFAITFVLAELILFGVNRWSILKKK